MTRKAVHRLPPIVRLAGPFQEFLADRAVAGGLLLACAVIAVIVANSPWSAAYDAFWQTRISIRSGDFALSESLLHWVNDGLMAIFFLSVGLEIKREILVGELSSRSRALLPASAAVGGALAPAAIYLILNSGSAAAAGWGIPIATDIAFVLGVMAVLRDRVPASLQLFLSALAIADDILAVAVIAVFYTAAIDPLALGAAAALWLGLFGLNRLGVRAPLVYAIVGVALWLALLYSGVHATIAGILLAAAVPASTRLDEEGFLERAHTLLHRFARSRSRTARLKTKVEEQRAALQALETAVDQVQPPLHQIEHALQPWVGFAVLPLFALANAGVDLRGGYLAQSLNPVTLGVVLGLVAGKPLGILLGCWAMIRTGCAELPAGTDWRQMGGLACLGGIGFTMSLFVAHLAFGGMRREDAQIGILAGSLLAGLLGAWLLGRIHNSEMAGEV